MARNPRTQTKTTVTPNFRPVDTFVQPAPLDTTRIRELDAFVGDLVPIRLGDTIENFIQYVQ